MVGIWWISIVLIFSRINKLAYYLEYLLLLFLNLRRVRLSRGGDRGELQKSNSTDVGELGNEMCRWRRLDRENVKLKSKG